VEDKQRDLGIGGRSWKIDGGGERNGEEEGKKDR
jgi:hypothetical protein